MNAILVLGGEKISFSEPVTIEKAVISAGRSPDAYLFLIDGRPIPMTTVLEDKMTVEGIRVASGG